MTDHTDTKALHGDWMDGDPDAEWRLFLRLRTQMRQMARGHWLMPVLRVEHDPEDLVHEALLKAFASDSFRRFDHRGRGSLKALLREVLENVMLDLARRASALKRGGHDEEATDGQGGRKKVRRMARRKDLAQGHDSEAPGIVPEHGGPGPRTVAMVNDLNERIAQLLDEAHLRVWKLHFEQGWTFPDIGALIGLSAARARGLYLEARKRLQASHLFDETWMKTVGARETELGTSKEIQAPPEHGGGAPRGSARGT